MGSDETLYELGREVSGIGAKMEGLETAVSSNFDRLHEKLDRLIVKVESHDDRLTSLEGTRKRQHVVLKWVGGLVTTVIGAALLVLVGLK